MSAQIHICNFAKYLLRETPLQYYFLYILRCSSFMHNLTISLIRTRKLIEVFLSLAFILIFPHVVAKTLLAGEEFMRKKNSCSPFGNQRHV